jgi:hypothetical protein
VEYFAVVTWRGDMALLDPPAIICRSWHQSEDPDLVGDEQELELELDLHARGWRTCDCFSRYVPEGEFGHVSERRLYAIAQSDERTESGPRVRAGPRACPPRCPQKHKRPANAAF